MARNKLSVPVKRTAIFALLGAVSGTIGALLSEFLPDPSRLFAPIKDVPGAVFFVPGTAIAFPGIVFGLIFAAMFLWHGAMRRGAAVVFATTSAIGNCLAISLALYLHDVRIDAIFGQSGSGPQTLPDWAACAIAGLEGGALLGGVTMGLLRGTSRSVGSLAAIGMVLGVPFGLLSDFTPAFAAWQAGYAVALSLCIPAATSWSRRAPAP